MIKKYYNRKNYLNKNKIFKDVCTQSQSLDSIKNNKNLDKPPAIGLRISSNPKWKLISKEKNENGNRKSNKIFFNCGC